MIRRPPSVSTRRSGGALLSLVVALVLMILAPFAAALEVHHYLATADHDGHQHSDSDLCQWVQHHTGNSLLSGAPVVASFFTIADQDDGDPGLSTSRACLSTGPPRGPPVC